MEIFMFHFHVLNSFLTLRRRSEPARQRALNPFVFGVIV